MFGAEIPLRDLYPLYRSVENWIIVNDDDGNKKIGKRKVGRACKRAESEQKEGR
jgi:hypothetical protein